GHHLRARRRETGPRPRRVVAPSGRCGRGRGRPLPRSDRLSGRLPAAVPLDLVLRLQDLDRDRARPVRAALRAALGEPPARLDRRPFRPLHLEQRHLLHGDRSRGRRPLLPGGVRSRAPAAAAAQRDPRSLPARPDGPLPIRDDPPVLPAARHPSAGNVLGLHRPRYRAAPPVRHLPDARLLPRSAAGTGRRRPPRRGERVGRLPSGDAAAGHPRTRDAGRLPVHVHLEPVPDAARLRPARRASPRLARDDVLLWPLHRRPRHDRRRRHHRHAPRRPALPRPPAPLHRGDHGRCAEDV
ncbi:MAG: hypothetical protein AVDCRST_MAG19-1877, partial [uncultured Thermomicrobiales bacterium]